MLRLFLACSLASGLLPLQSNSIITMLYWKTGFSWLQRGYEYTLLWGLVCFAIALRGGGPYSLDRKIGPRTLKIIFGEPEP